ncbi:MAG: CDP-diacylglycerol--serine O-phosphatidyltransferase [Gammaproteobacteria bacterium]|nr:CDP-diacylglycerol--serine O-phosphatidyltransferase [Gammaproteobacteria bacterium]
MSDKRFGFKVVGSDKSDSRQRRGVYLLPNLITTGAMFGGFFAIVAGVDGKFMAAAVAVFISMVLDALDGRVARLTKTESSFGAQFDSLSDMVAFGVAPALIVFEWGLQSLTTFGWLATFVYMACAALRLARFNISGDSRFFTGLPSPMAACVLAGGVWLFSDIGVVEPSLWISIGAAFLVVTIGILMVTNVRYFSPKVFRVKGRVPFVVLVLTTLGLAIIFANPPLVLFTVGVGYTLSGPVNLLWEMYRGPRESDEEIEEEDLDEDQI